MRRRPIIRIDLSAPAPAARQVADAVRALLVAGAFPPGARLPSVRSLGIDLGVNHNTIAIAYRTLAAEGWLELGRGRGATVRRRATPRANRRMRAGFARRLHELLAEVYSAGLSAPQIRAEIGATARSFKPLGYAPRDRQ